MLCYSGVSPVLLAGEPRIRAAAGEHIHPHTHGQKCCQCFGHGPWNCHRGINSHFPPELSKLFVFLSTFGNQLDLGMDLEALLASASSHPGASPAALQNCQIQWRRVRHWWGLRQIREYFELTHTHRHIFTTWHSTAEPLRGGGSGLSSSTCTGRYPHMVVLYSALTLGSSGQPLTVWPPGAHDEPCNSSLSSSADTFTCCLMKAGEA